MLLHKLIPHHSTPNLTDNIRWSIDLRYQKTGTPTDRVRYPAFITRSRSQPGAKYTDYEEWYQRWLEALKQAPLSTHPVRENPLNEHLTVSVD
ncbi:MAG TPA: hypothetical protein EYG11_01435 [Candidatus Latescibacteria bacterium]|nr:hypothetical protein [Candidatus Handelsmanbacteria bacterium]HIL07337.1 hypothetical protein [Candidatus Latescibacterota bacterium]